MFTKSETWASKVMRDPSLKKYSGKVYFSKEIMRPYYNSWIVQKLSPWRDELDKYILRLDQV